jgi:quinol monooxygenase YgiN
MIDIARELFIFARFHARPGNEGAVADALLEVIVSRREEAGCLSIHAFQSVPITVPVVRYAKEVA